MSTGKDITQRVQAQEALRESEERYRRLVELSFESIIIYSHGRIVYLNAAVPILLGAARPEDLIGKPVFDFIHSDYWDLAHARIQQMEQKGQSRLLLRYLNASGTSIAAPHVAGGLALLLSAYPGMPVTEQENMLLNSTADLGASGPDDTYGQGRIDMLTALQSISADMSVAQTASAGSMAVSEVLTYTLTISNTGPMTRVRWGPTARRQCGEKNAANRYRNPRGRGHHRAAGRCAGRHARYRQRV